MKSCETCGGSLIYDRDPVTSRIIEPKRFACAFVVAEGRHRDGYPGALAAKAAAPPPPPKLETATCPKCRAQARMVEAIDGFRGFFQCCGPSFVDFRMAIRRLAAMSGRTPAAEVAEWKRASLKSDLAAGAARARVLHRRN